MNGNSFCLDTNIIIYLLKGNEILGSFLRDKRIYISFVTQIELLSFRGLTREDRSMIKRFLLDVDVVHSNGQITNNAIAFRNNYGFKTPDAIIAATSQFLLLPLITSDKEFNKLDTFDMILFEL